MNMTEQNQVDLVHIPNIAYEKSNKQNMTNLIIQHTSSIEECTLYWSSNGSTALTNCGSTLVSAFEEVYIGLCLQLANFTLHLLSYYTGQLF